MALKGLSIGVIISLAVGLAVLAAAVPNAITSIETANTTGWSSGTVAIWGILGLVVVAGLLLVFVPRTKGE